MRALVLTLAATAAVAGCGGSSAEQPKTLPAVSTSPSATSPTPSPAATGIDAPTPQGATEFAKFFYGQVTRAFAAKDPSLVSAISLPSCKTCQLYIRSLTQLRDHHERATGAEFTITFAQAPALTGDEAKVSVIYDAPEALRFSATGKVIRREAAVHGMQEQVVLRRRGGSWVVAEVQ